MQRSMHAKNGRRGPHKADRGHLAILGRRVRAGAKQGTQRPSQGQTDAVLTRAFAHAAHGQFFTIRRKGTLPAT